MSYTYASTVTAIANLTANSATGTDFTGILPSMIDYAEGRLYRELNMLVEQVRDGSSSTVSGNRNFNLPTSFGTFIGPLDGINVVTPAATAPDSGTRTPLQPVSRDFLDLCYGDASSTGTPAYFAYISQANLGGSATSTQAQVIVGPFPDAAYRLEVIGTIQPAALSASNTTTYLTTYLPDLWIAACMVFMAGWQQNFGAQADTPQSSVSWEAQYTKLMESAATWEARKRWSGASWSSKSIEPLAQPQRG